MSSDRKPHRNGVPTTIRGVTYPSQAAAGRALGVSQKAVFLASERGTLDNVGLGRNHWRKRRMYLNGAPFETQKDMAAHLSIPARTIATMVFNARRAGKASVTRDFGTITWDDAGNV